MRQLNTEHWVLLAGFLGAIGVQVGTLEDGWAHVTSPAFVGSVLVQFSVFVRALFSEKPNGGRKL